MDVTANRAADTAARSTSDKIGRLLQERGVKPGERILLWAPNSPLWVAAYFGCHKIGAVVVPLDVRSTPEYFPAGCRTGSRHTVPAKL